MNRRGFTLIELLVAITVLVIIVTIVFVAFVSVTDTAAIARENTERMHLQQYLWRQISTNLNAVYSDAACEEPSLAFVSEDEEGPLGPADKLTVAAAVPMDGAMALPGVFKHITYEVTDPSYDGPLIADASVATDADADENQQKLVLRITEQPLVLSEFSAIEESEEHVEMEELDEFQQLAQVRQVPIASFDLSFYDGDDWVEVWDSVEMGTLPWAVRIKANFPRTQEELSADVASGINFDEDPDLDMVITLPLGAGVLSPWTDMNHSRRMDGAMQLGPDGQPLEPPPGEGAEGETEVPPAGSDGVSGAT